MTCASCVWTGLGPIAVERELRSALDDPEGELMEEDVSDMERDMLDGPLDDSSLAASACHSVQPLPEAGVGSAVGVSVLDAGRVLEGGSGEVRLPARTKAGAGGCRWWWF